MPKETIPGTKIPKPPVQLSGEDGNAFFIIGRCRKALRRVGATDAVIEKFTAEVQSGDYDQVIQTAMKYCHVK